VTLTRKGKAVAKHLLLREEVIETVNADEVPSAKAQGLEPLWEAPAQKADPDWYAAFEVFIATFTQHFSAR
jgi:hypothetical protein